VLTVSARSIARDVVQAADAREHHAEQRDALYPTRFDVSRRRNTSC
jgi:hypothetical protein